MQLNCAKTGLCRIARWVVSSSGPTETKKPNPSCVELCNWAPQISLRFTCCRTFDGALETSRKHLAWHNAQPTRTRTRPLTHGRGAGWWNEAPGTQAPRYRVSNVRCG